MMTTGAPSPLTQTTVTPITPAGRHFMFGYYDRCPYSPCGRYHLALEIPYGDTLPKPDDSATLYAIDLETQDLIKLTTTFAWNHQQASMNQWLPYEPGHIIVNDREGDHVFSKVVNMRGDEIRRLPLPIYALSKDGRTAATVNFARIQRRGYSYAVSNPADEKNYDLPDDDGLWIMDTKTGEHNLILSYKTIGDIHPHPEDLTDCFTWLNHAIFNCDDSRVMILFRYQIPHTNKWKTFLYTMNLDGSDVRLPIDACRWSQGGISHQEWGRTPDEILVDADYRGHGSEFTTVTDEYIPRIRHIAPGSTETGHQFFSPDGQWVMTDCYPRDGQQHVKIAHVDTGREIHLATMNHDVPGVTGDMRCDLHPRWRQDGKQLSIDSIHDGTRRIYLIDVNTE